MLCYSAKRVSTDHSAWVSKDPGEEYDEEMLW